MGRWTQYDEDSYRLPEGLVRIGYDADTMQYTFCDPEGQIYVGSPGATYGVLTPYSNVKSHSQSARCFADEREPRTNRDVSGKLGTSHRYRTFHEFLQPKQTGTASPKPPHFSNRVLNRLNCLGKGLIARLKDKGKGKEKRKERQELRRNDYDRITEKEEKRRKQVLRGLDPDVSRKPSGDDYDRTTEKREKRRKQTPRGLDPDASIKPSGNDHDRNTEERDQRRKQVLHSLDPNVSTKPSGNDYGRITEKREKRRKEVLRGLDPDVSTKGSGNNYGRITEKEEKRRKEVLCDLDPDVSRKPSGHQRRNI